MGIKELLIPSFFLTNIKANSKLEALESIINQIKHDPHILDADQLLQSLIERENLLSTEILDGIHIPHTKSYAVEGIVVVYAKVEINNKEELFFVILSNNSLITQYIKVISQLAKLLNQSSFANKIKESNRIEDIQHLIQLS